MKKIQVKVKRENDELNIEAYQGQNLMELLQRQKVYMSGICNGSGICGRCKVKVLEGKLSVTKADRRCLTEDEIEQQIHLACKASVEEDLVIEMIEKSEEDIVIESVPIQENNVEKRRKNKFRTYKSLNEEAEKYFIAIDIGTTTIAMALVNEKTGKVCDTYSCLNHQRKFGADVISRITAANNGKGKELKKLIEEDLWRGITKLIQCHEEKETNIYDKSERENIKSTNWEQECKKITKVIMVGNTTMMHLLLGYSCANLGKYPFKSDHLSQHRCTLKECIFDSQYSLYEDIPVIILPGISTFVGADITADMIACGGFETEKISLLIDLGTNGEMVLGNKDRLFVTSVAAGPAFEGGNIMCGSASVPGAVSRVKIQNQRAVIRTIKDKIPPVGICGTGLISAIAQLKSNKLMDEQGKLRFPYSEKGFSLWKNEKGDSVSLYQRDIREFQMAKAAIRAGIEVLMEKYGCRTEEIRQVYLAGGFGNGLFVDDVIETGILPIEFRGKTARIGNGALRGAVMYGKQKEIADLDIINTKITTISLAEEEEFQEKYVNYLDFELCN